VGTCIDEDDAICADAPVLALGLNFVQLSSDSDFIRCDGFGPGGVFRYTPQGNGDVVIDVSSSLDIDIVNPVISVRLDCDTPLPESCTNFSNGRTETRTITDLGGRSMLIFVNGFSAAIQRFS
jgi:hypothetical protein